MCVGSGSGARARDIEKGQFLEMQGKKSQGKKRLNGLQAATTAKSTATPLLWRAMRLGLLGKVLGSRTLARETMRLSGY
ncbi:hypothetical protein AB1N83_011543 [Pleurotus pulmonarius]